MIFGDTINVTYHKILYPPDTVKQRIPGYPDSLFIDINNDGHFDFLFLSKGDLEGTLGAGQAYFTISPFDSNSVMYKTMDTSECIVSAIRPIIKSFKFKDTLTEHDPDCFEKSFINYQLWMVGAPCGVYFGDYMGKYLGLKIHSFSANGLAWIKIKTIDGGFSYGPVGIIEEFAYKSLINSISEINSSECRIFPNPSSGKVTISIPHGLLPATVTIYNYLGMKLTEKVLTNNLLTIDLPRGIYIVQMASKNIYRQSEKLIVE